VEEKSKMMAIRHQVPLLDRQIRRWIFHACCSNSVPELAQVILVKWNPRFTRRMGDGHYNIAGYRATIRLSLPLWPRATEEDRKDTVIHETCHVIVGYMFGWTVPPHGLQWQEAMKRCGLQPERLHSVDRTGLARRQRRFIILDCPNSGIEKKCRCTVREYNELRRGVEFSCRNCGLHLDGKSALMEAR
jgi:SprT protein